MNEHGLDIGDDLEITKTTRRASGGGTWVIGKLNGHRFDALVFPEHAICAEYEMGQSRISKLWIRREADKQVVCNFDRGWDIRPTTKTAAAIVDFLAAGLAEHTYGCQPPPARKERTMTIDELIARLEEYRDALGGETEVRLMTQQNWPFENEITGLASGEEINDACEGEDACDDQDVDEDTVVFIVEGEQRCYGSGRAWQVAY